MIDKLLRELEAAAFRADPDSALARLAEPVLLDEWAERVVAAPIATLWRTGVREPAQS